MAYMPPPHVWNIGHYFRTNIPSHDLLLVSNVPYISVLYVDLSNFDKDNNINNTTTNNNNKDIST